MTRDEIRALPVLMATSEESDGCQACEYCARAEPAADDDSVKVCIPRSREALQGHTCAAFRSYEEAWEVRE